LGGGGRLTLGPAGVTDSEGVFMKKLVYLQCFLAALVAAVLCLGGVAPSLTAAPSSPTVRAGSGPGSVGRPTPVVHGKKLIQVYAHRGARSFAPENAMPGYRAGLAIGTHWVDMDVVMDKGGDIVVSHDIWLNPDIVRGPDGEFLAASKAALIAGVAPADLTAFLQPYLAKNLTYEQLRQYDVGRLNPQSPYAAYFPEQHGRDGVRMPLLKDVVRYVRRVTHGRVGFQIEFKTDPVPDDWTYTPRRFAAALYKVLRAEGITRACEVQSFDWRCLYELQKLDKRIATAYLTEWDNEPGTEYSFFSDDPAVAGLWTGGELVKDHGGSIPRMVKELGGSCWEPEDVELTKAALDEAHGLGLKVVVWTWPEHSGSAFDPVTVARMIDWGVDGIITDDPGRLISTLAARGYVTPRGYDTAR